jgi:hypothetical protein
MIPKQAFEGIYNELKLKPLMKNEYRYKAGTGLTQCFGIVNKRSLPCDYSRQNWYRPYLYKLLLDFGAKYIDISYNSVQVNHNYKADKHRDKNNVGDSVIVAFGNYTGGNLVIHEGDLSGTHDIRYKPIKGDFSKNLHSVDDFTGDRVSLVYFTYAKKGIIPDLPPFSIREEQGQYYFYRGDTKLTRGNGIPHPLQGRKKGVAPAPKPPPDVSFDVVFP